MKSEKARQELEDGSWKVEVGYEGEDVDLPYHAVRVDVAQYAVELAEQEAGADAREGQESVRMCLERNAKTGGRGMRDKYSGN